MGLSSHCCLQYLRGLKSFIQIALFKCRWVQGSQGVTRDKNWFVSIDIRNVGYKTEPFVPGKRRIIGVHNAVDEEEFNQSLLLQLVSSPT